MTDIEFIPAFAAIAFAVGLLLMCWLEHRINTLTRRIEALEADAARRRANVNRIMTDASAAARRYARTAPPVVEPSAEPVKAPSELIVGG